MVEPSAPARRSVRVWAVVAVVLLVAAGGPGGPACARGGRVAVITPSAADPDLAAKGWKTFHRAVTNTLGQGPAAARYMRRGFFAEKVFVIDDGSDYGVSLAASVRDALGGALVGTASVKPGSNLTTAVKKIAKSDPDAIFYAGWIEGSHELFTQIHSAGVTADLMGGDSLYGGDLFTAGDAVQVDGMAVTCSCAPSSILDFQQAFRNDMHAWPGDYSGTAYDATNIMLLAIAHGIDTRADMLAFINGYEGTGVSGAGYQFTATGELDPRRARVAVFTVRGGSFDFDTLEPTDDSNT